MASECNDRIKAMGLDGDAAAYYRHGFQGALEWALEQGDNSHWVNELSGVVSNELERVWE